MRSELVTGLLVVAWAGGAPSAAAEPVLVERILAVVDARPVLLSEVQLVQRLRGLDRPGAIEALIDEQLMYRQAARLPQTAPSPEEEEAAVQSVVEQLRTAPGMLDTEAIRDLARRQARILKYVDFRFRPLVQVDPDVLEDSAEAGDPAALAAAEQLRRRRTTEGLDQRLEEWVAELRAAADIRYTTPGGE
jgi:hypothetical protein